MPYSEKRENNCDHRVGSQWQLLLIAEQELPEKQTTISSSMLKEAVSLCNFDNHKVAVKSKIRTKQAPQVLMRENFSIYEITVSARLDPYICDSK